MITGTFSLIDSQDSLLGFSPDSSRRVGTFSLIDSTDIFLGMSGCLIEGVYRLEGDSTFIQDKLLPHDSNGLGLTLWDATFLNGTPVIGPGGDTTYVDSTYVTRLFDPYSISYSIWDLSDGTTLFEQWHRPPAKPTHPTVGQYYANMYAPDNPGRYEIRWRYRKDSSSNCVEIKERFKVETGTVSPNRS